MLKTTTAGNLVSEKTHTFTASHSDSIETVLGKLCVHELLSLPVVDDNKRLLGVISVMDLLIYLAWSPYFEKGELDPTEATTLKNLDRPISQLLGLTGEGRKLWIFEPTMPLSALIEPFSHGLHRVLVPQKDDEGKNAYRVLSQSDVVSYIYKHKDEVKGIMGKTLAELGVNEKPVVYITSNTTALEGFKTMTLEKVLAIAILDENKKLVGNLSASDMRGITTRRLKKVISPVLEFVKAVHGGTLREPLSIRLEDKLEDALALIIKEGVHRLWIVDQKKEVIGVLSLSDIIALFA